MDQGISYKVSSRHKNILYICIENSWVWCNRNFGTILQKNNSDEMRSDNNNNCILSYEDLNSPGTRNCLNKSYTQYYNNVLKTLTTLKTSLVHRALCYGIIVGNLPHLQLCVLIHSHLNIIYKSRKMKGVTNNRPNIVSSVSSQ